MMPSWKSYGVLAAGAVAAFAAGRMTRDPASGSPSNNPASPTGKPGTAKPGSTAAEEDLSATIRRLENASLADCEALLAGRKLLDLPPLVAEALLQRFSELAPERVADLLLDVPGGGTLHSSWRTWINWLGKNHPDLLRAKLAGSSLNVALRDSIEDAIFFGSQTPAMREGLEELLGKDYASLEQLADSDPDQVIRYLAKRLEAGESTLLNPDLYLKLARANPTALQALIPLLRGPDDQLRLITPLAKVLAGDDPALAVALFDSLPASRVRSSVALEIADAWTKRDPAAALAWVQANLPEGVARRLALSICLAPLAESDPMKVLALLPREKGLGYQQLSFYARPSESSDGFSTSGLGGGAQFADAQTVRNRALIALVESNPQQALEFIRQSEKTLRGSGGDLDVIAKGAAEWFDRDPAAAMSWIVSAGEDGTFLSGSAWFGKGLVNVDPEMLQKAAASLGSVADPELAAMLTKHFASALVLDDPAAALRQAGQLPEALRGPWMNAAFQAYAKTDPFGAADVVMQLPEAQRREIHSQVAKEWMSNDLALAYLDRLPPAEQTVGNYQEVLKRWSWNGGSLENWWSSLGEEDVTARAAALSVSADKLYNSNPASAGELVAQIGAVADTELRLQALERLVKAMAAKDPDAAQALADRPGMELPEEGLNQMRAGLERALKEK